MNNSNSELIRKTLRKFYQKPSRLFMGAQGYACGIPQHCASRSFGFRTNSGGVSSYQFVRVSCFFIPGAKAAKISLKCLVFNYMHHVKRGVAKLLEKFIKFNTYGFAIRGHRIKRGVAL